MPPIQIAGILLITGTLSFWFGAAMPTWEVYTKTDPDVRARLITDKENYWILSHLFSLIGAVTVAVGMGAFTSTVEATPARILAMGGLAAMVVGALVWVHIAFAFRLLMVAEEYVHTTAGGWTFPTYTVLTLGANVLFGVVLLMGDFPVWSGLAAISLSSLILIAFLIQKDSVPPFFYIPTLIVGIALLT